MKFIFEEEEPDDEDFLDLSDLSGPSRKVQTTRVSNTKRRRNTKSITSRPKKKIQKQTNQTTNEDVKKKPELGFSFEEEVPPPRTITDPEVKKRAKEGRKRSTNSMSYENKRAAGWSYYCAHMRHLPTLCEKGQIDGEVTCTCTCHEARGFVRPKSEQISGSDDEEYIFLFD